MIKIKIQTIEVDDDDLLAAVVKVFLALSDNGQVPVEIKNVRIGLGMHASQEHLLIEKIQGYSGYLWRWSKNKRFLIGIVRPCPRLNEPFHGGQQIHRYIPSFSEKPQPFRESGPIDVLKGPFLLYGREGVFYWTQVPGRPAGLSSKKGLEGWEIFPKKCDFS